MYAIGGSASPTINSQGNRFLAPDDRSKKEVSAHIKTRILIAIMQLILSLPLYTNAFSFAFESMVLF